MDWYIAVIIHCRTQLNYHNKSCSAPLPNMENSKPPAKVPSGHLMFYPFTAFEAAAGLVEFNKY